MRTVKNGWVNPPPQIFWGENFQKYLSQTTGYENSFLNLKHLNIDPEMG